LALRVISLRRSNSVVFGAKRTSRRVNEYTAKDYTSAPQFLSETYNELLCDVHHIAGAAASLG